MKAQSLYLTWHCRRTIRTHHPLFIITLSALAFTRTCMRMGVCAWVCWGHGKVCVVCCVLRVVWCVVCVVLCCVCIELVEGMCVGILGCVLLGWKRGKSNNFSFFLIFNSAGKGVEVWGPKSNLLQVILSIQGLILGMYSYERWSHHNEWWEHLSMNNTLPNVTNVMEHHPVWQMWWMRTHHPNVVMDYGCGEGWEQIRVMMVMSNENK